MSTTQPMARPAPGAWSVADNLAGIEFTPDDLERLELCWTSRWRRRGKVFHDVGIWPARVLDEVQTGDACPRCCRPGHAILEGMG
jgi:hypothetical protein